MPPYNVVKAKEAALSKVTLTNLVDIYDAWRDHDLDRLASHLPADFSHSLNIPREILAVGGKVRPG
jgi:hypothetical protein